MTLNEVGQVTQETPQMNSGCKAEIPSVDAMCFACIAHCGAGKLRIRARSQAVPLHGFASNGAMIGMSCLSASSERVCVPRRRRAWLRRSDVISDVE